MIATVKIQQSTPRINAISKRIQPQKDEILEISVDEADQSKVVRVGVFLSDEMQCAIIDFLKQNMSTFAWTTSDMKGINSFIMSHELNVDPTIKPSGKNDVNLVLSKAKLSTRKSSDCPQPALSRRFDTRNG